jgi:DNA-binding MarR family transcriptional regulator
MDTKDCQSPEHSAHGDAVAVHEARNPQADHDLVVELLKVFATLDRAMTAHRQFHMAEAARFACDIEPTAAMRGRPSPAQIQLSIELSERGPGTISELASRLRVSASAISLLVDRMVAHGMVERVRSTDDRRVVHVRLSQAAGEMASAMLRTWRTLFARFLQDTPPGDRSAFLRHIDRLAQTLDAPLEPLGGTSPKARASGVAGVQPPANPALNPSIGVQP